MKQELTPLQIAISIIAVVCVVVVVGLISVNSRPSVPVAAVIPPPSVGKVPSPPPADKTNQVVGAASSGNWVPPSQIPGPGSSTTNGAPQAPMGGPPPRP